MSTERDFSSVFDLICKELTPNERKNCIKYIQYFAPEAYWFALSTFIYRHIRRSRFDERSVRIYSLLCNKSRKEIKKLFEDDSL